MPLFDHGVPGTARELVRQLKAKVRLPSVTSFNDLSDPFELGRQYGRAELVQDIEHELHRTSEDDT